LGRVLRLKRGFAIARHRIAAGTPAAAALAATLARLTTATLPGPQDSPVLVPPVLRAWSRRVPGFNLWVFFTFTESAVDVLTVATTPPVPIEER
jgi:hypothetical protein